MDDEIKVEIKKGRGRPSLPNDERELWRTETKKKYNVEHKDETRERMHQRRLLYDELSIPILKEYRGVIDDIANNTGQCYILQCMRKLILILMVIVFTVFACGCTSKEDEESAQLVSLQIDTIILRDTVLNMSQDNKILIQSALVNYDLLTSAQKEMVTNYQTLETAISNLIYQWTEQKAKYDPSGSVTKNQIAGVWQGSGQSLYFSSAVYWMGSASVTSSDFTEKYKIASSFAVKGFDYITKHLEGSFYVNVSGTSPILGSITVSGTCTFKLKRTESGNMTIVTQGNEDTKTIHGTYAKNGNAFQSPDKELCVHEGCDLIAIGDSNSCTKHSANCIKCDEYIDDNTFFCLNCLIRVAEKNKKITLP